MASLGGRGQRGKVFLEEAVPHLDALYRMALRTYGNHDLAQDLVQETFKEAWKSIDHYQPGTNCKAWLFRILFRVGGRQLRREKALRQVDWAELPEGRLAVAPESDDRLEQQQLMKFVMSMPENYRTVLVLADVESLAYREIAEVLELPMGTVMSRLNRARTLLREKLRHGRGNPGGGDSVDLERDRDGERNTV